MLFDGSELGLTASSVNLSGITVLTGAVTTAPGRRGPIADQSATQDLPSNYTVPAHLQRLRTPATTLTYSASLTGGGGRQAG